MLTHDKTTDSLLSFRSWADLVIVLGVLSASDTYLSIDQNLNDAFIVLTSLLVFFSYCIGVSYKAVVWLSRGRPELAAVNVTKIAIVSLPWLLGIYIGDYVHLALYYPTYRQQIEVQGGKGTNSVRFFWGDRALWLTDGLQADTLVYDPTDALAAFVGEVRDADQPGLGLETRHLTGHFYVEHEFSR